MSAAISTASAALGQGRYFRAISLTSALILVTFVWLLVGSGAWSGPPDWNAAVASIASVDLAGLVVFAVAVAGVAYTMHPIQFGMTQLLEGYWGATRLSAALGELGIRQQVRRRQRADRLGRLIPAEFGEHSGVAGDGTNVELTHRADRLGVYVATALTRLRADYPAKPVNWMPTLLGNVLRRFETQGGSHYGLDVVAVAPHLVTVADDDMRLYIRDRRTEMDAAVRMVITWLIATLLGTAFLWRHGLAMLIPVSTYLLAIISYRGAVVAARSFANSMRTAVDLYRFDLLRALHLPLPATNDDERKANRKLDALLSGRSVKKLKYDHGR